MHFFKSAFNLINLMDVDQSDIHGGWDKRCCYKGNRNRLILKEIRKASILLEKSYPIPSPIEIKA